MIIPENEVCYEEILSFSNSSPSRKSYPWGIRSQSEVINAAYSLCYYINECITHSIDQKNAQFCHQETASKSLDQLRQIIKDQNLSQDEVNKHSLAIKKMNLVILHMGKQIILKFC